MVVLVGTFLFGSDDWASAAIVSVVFFSAPFGSEDRVSTCGPNLTLFLAASIFFWSK